MLMIEKRKYVSDLLHKYEDSQGETHYNTPESQEILAGEKCAIIQCENKFPCYCTMEELMKYNDDMTEDEAKDIIVCNNLENWLAQN